MGNTFSSVSPWLQVSPAFVQNKEYNGGCLDELLVYHSGLWTWHAFSGLHFTPPLDRKLDSPWLHKNTQYLWDVPVFWPSLRYCVMANRCCSLYFGFSGSSRAELFAISCPLRESAAWNRMFGPSAYINLRRFTRVFRPILQYKTVTSVDHIPQRICLVFCSVSTCSLQLFGVVLGSLQGGMGEAMCLAMSAFYDSRSVITFWSSGTGFAGTNYHCTY